MPRKGILAVVNCQLLHVVDSYEMEIDSAEN